jgi:DNA-directed RNA polymerase specialized sigma24 family protein
VLADEVEQLMRRLDPIERQILELRLQSYDLDEIAAATKRSQRTVRRVLDRVKEHLQQAASCLGRMDTSERACDVGVTLALP